MSISGLVYCAISNRVSWEIPFYDEGGIFLKFILWTSLTILADIFLDRSTLHRGITGRVDSCTEGGFFANMVLDG